MGARIDRRKENNSRNNHESFVVTTTRSQSWRLQRIVHNFLGDRFDNLVAFFFLYLIVVIFIVDGLRVNFLGIHHRRRKWRTRTSIDDQGRHDSVIILSVIIQSTSQFNGRVQINTQWRSLFEMSYASHDRK